jgi:hypothetical protein
LEKGEGGEKASMDFLGITCWRERERERERDDDPESYKVNSGKLSIIHFLIYFDI